MEIRKTTPLESGIYHLNYQPALKEISPNETSNLCQDPKEVTDS